MRFVRNLGLARFASLIAAGCASQGRPPTAALGAARAQEEADISLRCPGLDEDIERAQTFVSLGKLGAQSGGTNDLPEDDVLFAGALASLMEKHGWNEVQKEYCFAEALEKAGLADDADFAAGAAAYERGDYGTALKLWRPLAERGNAVAQRNLGVMYEFGRGVPQNDVAAVTWYRKAAEQGDARAQNNLGSMYADGRGVPQDQAEALKWYRKAAEQGQAGGQYNLGYVYHEGRGVPKDDAQAVQWYRKAAEQGYAFAQHNLGYMYMNGWGVPRDFVRAHMWLGIAAARFAPGPYRDETVKNRDLAARFMTPAQIAEAERLAREWLAAHPNLPPVE